jgi:hypothetical protein
MVILGGVGAVWLAGVILMAVDKARGKEIVPPESPSPFKKVTPQERRERMRKLRDPDRRI